MNDDNDFVTLVIQHSVQPAATDKYELWLREIAQECRRFKGHLGVNIIRPHGASSPYTIVLRFDSHEHLRGWIESDTRERLIQDAHPLLLDAEELELQTGLEYWFTPPGSKQVHAKPFKQFLITLSAIFPLTVVVPWALHPLITRVPFLADPIAAKFLTAVLIVLLMVYVIMPRYTRLVAGWLFR